MPIEFKVSIALHIIGIVMWVGGLMVLARFLKLFTEPGTGRDALVAMMRRVYFGYSLIGCFLALATGIFQLMLRGPAFYFSQGWFHTKLTLIIILFIATLVVAFDLKSISSGTLLSRGKVAAIHGLIGLVLLVAVFLTILGRVG